VKVPEGFVLVPIEITAAMEGAWKQAFSLQLQKRSGRRGARGFKRLKNPESAEAVAYRAMLSQRPEPIAAAPGPTFLERMCNPPPQRVVVEALPDPNIIPGPRIPLRHGSAATQIDVAGRRWRREYHDTQWYAVDDYSLSNCVVDKLVRVIGHDLLTGIAVMDDEGFFGINRDGVFIDSWWLPQHFEVLASSDHLNPFEQAIADHLGEPS
jgi:hypothetical protein